MWSLFKRIREQWARAREEEEKFDRRWHEADDNYEAEFEPLPIEEAKRRAEALLSDPARFRCEEGPIADQEREKMRHLGPHLREFFERFKRVEEGGDFGSALIARDLLCKPVIETNGRVSERLLLIGDRNGSHSLFVVELGDEVIREMGEAGELTFPSVYHLLLDLDLHNWE